MARTKKPEPIDTYRHEKTRVEVQVFLDRNTFEYYADYAGRKIKNKDHGALLKELREAIEAYNTLVWQPVIHITVDTRGNTPFLAFTYDRFLVCNRQSKGGAKLKGGDMLKCPWHVERTQRKSEAEIEALQKKLGRGTFYAEEHDPVPYEGMEIPDELKLGASSEWHWDVDRNGPFQVPCRPKGWRGVEDEIWVAYDERVWTTLTILHVRLRALATAVKTHILDAERLLLLASTGVTLLGLPSVTNPSPSEPKDEEE